MRTSDVPREQRSVALGVYSPTLSSALGQGRVLMCRRVKHPKVNVTALRQQEKATKDLSPSVRAESCEHESTSNRLRFANQDETLDFEQCAAVLITCLRPLVVKMRVDMA